ncbi:DUF4825 domain-containing protein [Bacillus sp. BHET2]|uniref:DUF4825 domain-containing protein n=1 Tax=Bacillus sp. BHET2 TaxID=2583818 RepID=UPI0014864BCB|nr:DUF4825 domain-containing protein [Bacillus sp. BHET2]
MIFNKMLGMLILTLMVLLTGCGSNPEKQADITSIEDVSMDTLKENSGTYVGDNSKVQAILQELPGGETIKEIDLSGEMVKVTYGYKEGKLSENDVNEYWFDGTNVNRKNFYFNAIYLTLLVPNAKEYHFTVDESMVSVTRDKMVAGLSKEFSDFPKEENIWDKKTVASFIDKHQGKLTEMATKYQTFFE